jgi:hypothetical protein
MGVYGYPSEIKALLSAALIGGLHADEDLLSSTRKTRLGNPDWLRS